MRSRWQPYSAYKDSGVAWLGKVPTHWQDVSCKWLARLEYGDSLPSDSRENGDVPVLGSNGPVGTHSTPNTGAPVIVVGRKGSYGKVNFSTKPVFAIDTTYYVDAQQSKASLRWLFYVLQLLPLDSFSRDSAVPGLSREFAYEQRLPLVPLAEQRAIAAFLDRETSQIDTLIRKQERLIELLEEKREALISHAVTKGLDPGVPMKDADVRWLGQIPEHWQAVRARRVAKCIQTGTTPPTGEERYYEGGVVPWFGPSSFGNDLLLRKPVKLIAEAAITENVARLFPEKSTLVVTIGATLGKVGYLPAPASSNQQITAISFREENVYPKFAAYQLKSLEPAMREIAPNTTLPILNQQDVSTLPVILPPVSEQRSIVAYLDRETAKIDKLIATIEEMINRLQEYRTGLVSAAVTGKIDVREEASPT